jgi:DNA primase
MLIDRSLVERVAERHGPDDFRDMDYRAVFAALLAVPADTALDVVAERLTGTPLRVLRELTEGIERLTPDAADITVSLARLDARRLEQRIAEIRDAMRRAPREQQDVLMRERMDLEAELRRLLPIRMPRSKPRE